MKETLFEKGVLDYADSLDNFIYKHTISKSDLIRKIIELSVEPIDLTELSIDFDEIIKENTVNENNEALWSWKFSLPEWDVQYQFVTKEEFVFERVLNLVEVRQIVQTRRDRLDEIIKDKIINITFLSIFRAVKSD